MIGIIGNKVICSLSWVVIHLIWFNFRFRDWWCIWKDSLIILKWCSDSWTWKLMRVLNKIFILTYFDCLSISLNLLILDFVIPMDGDIFIYNWSWYCMVVLCGSAFSFFYFLFINTFNVKFYIFIDVDVRIA